MKFDGLTCMCCTINCMHAQIRHALNLALATKSQTKNVAFIDEYFLTT